MVFVADVINRELRVILLRSTDNYVGLGRLLRFTGEKQTSFDFIQKPINPWLRADSFCCYNQGVSKDIILLKQK